MTIFADNSLIYHYTSKDALLNILRNDSIYLRATHYSSLNDTNEIIEGVDVINEVLFPEKVALDDFNDAFITSFSKRYDILPMWGMYGGNGNGCALGFNHSQLHSYIIRCTYGKEEIKQQFNTFHNLILTGAITHIGDEKHPSLGILPDGIANIFKEFSKNKNIIASCLGAKNKSFDYEEETRLVVLNNDAKLPVKFKNRNNKIIPYVEYQLKKETLSEVYLGPCNNMNSDEKALRMFLDYNGYKHVDIKKSALPYKG